MRVSITEYNPFFIQIEADCGSAIYIIIKDETKCCKFCKERKFIAVFYEHIKSFFKNFLFSWSFLFFVFLQFYLQNFSCLKENLIWYL